MKMKIAVTADIHFGTDSGEAKLHSLVKTLVKNDINYLVIAGDLASRGGNHPTFRQALEILKTFPGTILFTPGNHDLWADGDGDDSYTLWRETLPNLFAQAGHRMLDGNPFILNSTGFVGTVGWYDYSFRHVPPFLSMLFDDVTLEFSDGAGTRHVRWKDLTDEDYIDKRSKITTDRKQWKVSTWQDKKFIRWNFSDRKFLNLCLEQLQEDIDRIYPEVEDIIVVTHHLPFVEFVPDIPDPTWSFHRAYLGSEKTGELLKRYDKVRYVFSGHVHRKAEAQIGNIRAYTTFFHATPGLHVITIEE